MERAFLPHPATELHNRLNLTHSGYPVFISLFHKVECRQGKTPLYLPAFPEPPLDEVAPGGKRVRAVARAANRYGHHFFIANTVPRLGKPAAARRFSCFTFRREGDVTVPFSDERSMHGEPAGVEKAGVERKERSPNAFHVQGTPLGRLHRGDDVAATMSDSEAASRHFEEALEMNARMVPGPGSRIPPTTMPACCWSATARAIASGRSSSPALPEPWRQSWACRR